MPNSKMHSNINQFTLNVHLSVDVARCQSYLRSNSRSVPSSGKVTSGSSSSGTSTIFSNEDRNRFCSCDMVDELERLVMSSDIDGDCAIDAKELKRNMSIIYWANCNTFGVCLYTSSQFVSWHALPDFGHGIFDVIQITFQCHRFHFRRCLHWRCWRRHVMQFLRWRCFGHSWCCCAGFCWRRCTAIQHLDRVGLFVFFFKKKNKTPH